MDVFGRGGKERKMKQPHAKFNGHFYTAHDLESKAIFNIGWKEPWGPGQFHFSC